MDESIDCITEINDINMYLEKISQQKNELLIIISVKDTPGAHVKDKTVQLLKQLGIKNNIKNKHWHSYIAVIDKGTVLKDILSREQESLVVENLLIEEAGIVLNVYSSIFIRENRSIIMINDRDYSSDKRGLNIVIYDYKKRDVIDSVVFDTHVAGNDCIHTENKNNMTSGMKYALGYHLLSTKLEQNKNEIDKLKKLILEKEKRIEILLWALFRQPGEDEIETRQRFFKSLPKANEPVRTIQKAGLILLKVFDKICIENNIEYWICSGTLLGAVRHLGFIPWDDDIDVFMCRDDYYKLAQIMKNNNDFVCEEFFKAVGPKDKYIAKRYVFKYKQNVDKTSIMFDIGLLDVAGSECHKNLKKLNNVRSTFTKKFFASNITKVPNSGSNRVVIIRKEDAEYKEYDEFFQKYFDEYKKLIGEADKKEYLVWAIDNFDYNVFNKGEKRIVPYDIIFPLKKIIFENNMFLAPNKASEYLKMFYGDIMELPNDMAWHKHFNASDLNFSYMNELIEKYS